MDAIDYSKKMVKELSFHTSRHVARVLVVGTLLQFLYII
jgi:hypothetical protein